MTAEEKEEQKKLKKEAKAKAKAERKAKGENWWNDFKKFVSRGNVLDMSVGVIMGGAFNAIVTAFTNILLSICTWAVPGGLKGLVTVLPAVNSAQEGVSGIGQTFASSDLADMATVLASNNGVTLDPTSDGYATALATWETKLTGLYTLHGSVYTYNMSAVIDWGTFINAVISFIVVAFTLFIIVKVFNSLHEQRVQFEKAVKEKEAEKKGAKAEAQPAEGEAK